MAEPPTLPAAEVMDLLAAIREALTVPAPATSADLRARDRLLMERVATVRSVLNSLSNGGRLSALTGPTWWAEHLRDMTKLSPVTYLVHEPVSSPVKESPAVAS